MYTQNNSSSSSSSSTTTTNTNDNTQFETSNKHTNNHTCMLIVSSRKGLSSTGGLFRDVQYIF